MNNYIALERVKAPSRADTGFIVSVILLCGLGLATLYSGTAASAQRVFHNQYYFFIRQIVFACFGCAFLAAAAFVDLTWLRAHLFELFLITLALCLLTFVPGLGQKRNGAARWIGVGRPFFQPSELVKITLPLVLANFFDKRADSMGNAKKTLAPACCITGLFFAVIVAQNDFSTAAFILFVSLTIFFMAGVKIRWFLGLFCIVAPFAFLFVFSKEHRVTRLLSFFAPDYDLQGAGFQVEASLRAIGSGGFWGRGLGGGVRKVASVPMVQSDFIFDVWAEEMGFAGVAAYFALLGFFAVCGYRISLLCACRFRSLLSFGAVSMILFQSLMNIGVAVKALPATGITLPFFSAGGSSLVTTLALCGLIINVSRWNAKNDKRDEYERSYTIG